MASRNVLVAVRVRPPAAPEGRAPDEAVFEAVGGAAVRERSAGGRAFSYDHAFGPDVSTRRLYDAAVAPVVSAAFEGVNGTVFAYGQTASGKTHTMIGGDAAAADGVARAGGAGAAAEPGVLPLAMRDVFARAAGGGGGGRETLLRASYVELYNESLRDLLAPRAAAASSAAASPSAAASAGCGGGSGPSFAPLAPPPAPLQIVEDRARGPVVRGLREEVVTSAAQADALRARGDAARTVAPTGRNERSSRSHALFRLVIETRVGDGDEEEGDNDGNVAIRATRRGREQPAVKVATLYLVDLAGSEVRHLTSSRISMRHQNVLS